MNKENLEYVVMTIEQWKLLQGAFKDLKETIEKIEKKERL